LARAEIGLRLERVIDPVNGIGAAPFQGIKGLTCAFNSSCISAFAI
jgi:hypothetical protein